jgi:hypothetical protein
MLPFLSPCSPTQCWACVMVIYQKLFRYCLQHWTEGEGVLKFVLSMCINFVILAGMVWRVVQVQDCSSSPYLAVLTRIMPPTVYKLDHEGWGLMMNLTSTHFPFRKSRLPHIIFNRITVIGHSTTMDVASWIYYFGN